MTVESPHKTRAEVYRDMVDIRLAGPDSGEHIALILKENEIDLECDWSRVSANWLIACVDDEVIGCVQVLPATPVAWCEFLLVKPSAPFKIRAIAIRKLMQQAIATAHVLGATYVAGMVHGKNQKFYDVLTKMGCTAVAPHMAMLKRLK